ncbi:cytochrome P450 family protein [Actinoalloteichus hymeniacidonis]|uniref:Cytochrome P450 n=1 Tax=Actinoalloteichus hymeniacidonis TaxID=340345 RepID=A0AAC9HT79_9PSEU|nr:cytochrome P450 [Actinoalloteichus hymeniacidonis]AOS64506.1 cytochrome P450 [Actinoalloteichus hymeniacidonis]MBB5907422.1 cytochrome P450 [Actinoalloteichus hymeniacidonis]
MTADSAHAAAAAQPRCPAHAARIPLHGAEFSQDPARFYADLREHGPVAKVELAPGVPASLVTDYSAALTVLRDPISFPRDPHHWQRSLPPTASMIAAMAFQPLCLIVDDSAHARLRGAMSDGLDRVDPTLLRASVERSADLLIDEFIGAGRAELLADYAAVLPTLVLAQLYGASAGLGKRLMAGAVRAKNRSPHRTAVDLHESVSELVAYKRARRGTDVTSAMLDHPAELTDEEVVDQLTALGYGVEPLQNWITNSLRLLLSDERFAGAVSGSVVVEDVLTEVLWADPPIANHAPMFPVRDVEVQGVPLPAHQPVLISFAAANTDPELAVGQERAGNRAHLAFGAGPHSCPAQAPARVIATVGIERLLDRLPDLELAVPADRLTWRPGPYHRALAGLPVRFTAVGARSTSDRSTPRAPEPDTVHLPRPTARPTPSESDGEETGPAWWQSLTRWWRDR